MRSLSRSSLALVVIGVLVLVLAAPTAADEPPANMRAPAPVPTREAPTVAQKIGDVAFARPVSAVRLAVGVVAFPLTFVVGAVLGDPGWAFDVCVRDPARDLFQRPLGRL